MAHPNMHMDRRLEGKVCVITGGTVRFACLVCSVVKQRELRRDHSVALRLCPAPPPRRAPRRAPLERSCTTTRSRFLCFRSTSAPRFRCQPPPDGPLADSLRHFLFPQSGIGRDTVQRYTEEGAKVLFCGRGEEAGNAIAEEYNTNDNCVYMKCDVMVEEEIEAVIEAAVAKWGRLDVLFNNAGGGGGLPSVAKVTQQAIHNTFALNFDSMCYGIKHAVPHMKKQRTASIINNTSIAAHRAGFGDALYSAAKSAMESYGRLAAMELAPDGIRVNAIAPGATATPIFWSGSPGSARGATLSDEDNAVRQAKVEANIVNNVSPLRIGRSGTGMDIAQTAVFLASDESEWITAQDFIVDGGITTFDAPNKGWMADKPMVDPVPIRANHPSKL